MQNITNCKYEPKTKVNPPFLKFSLWCVNFPSWSDKALRILTSFLLQKIFTIFSYTTTGLFCTILNTLDSLHSSTPTPILPVSRTFFLAVGNVEKPFLMNFSFSSFVGITNPESLVEAFEINYKEYCSWCCSCSMASSSWTMFVKSLICYINVPRILIGMLASESLVLAILEILLTFVHLLFWK